MGRGGEIAKTRNLATRCVEVWLLPIDTCVSPPPPFAEINALRLFFQSSKSTVQSLLCSTTSIPELLANGRNQHCYLTRVFDSAASAFDVSEFSLFVSVFAGLSKTETFKRFFFRNKK